MPNNTVCLTPRCRKYTNLNDEGYCTTCVQKREKLEENVTPYPCATCQKNCKDENSCMQCDFCLEWSHTICIDMSNDTYKALIAVKGSRWYCSKCNTKVDNLLDKANSLELETQAVKSDVADLKKRMETVETKLKGSVEKEISMALNEKTDIERRKMNLVVFNLPEQKSDKETAWEVPELINKDIEDITKIIKDDLGIELENNAITDARRLGRKQVGKAKPGDKNKPDDSNKPGNSEEKSRPMKIVFSDIRKKREVLEAAKKLRTSDNPVAKKLFLNPDLTEKQRENDRNLRNLMWERRLKGENVIIQKGKIVEADYEVRKTRQPLAKVADSSKKGPQ